MALQLGALRDALLAAIGILVVVLASQAGLWSEYGKLSAQAAQISTQITRVSEQLDQVGRAIGKP